MISMRDLNRLRGRPTWLNVVGSWIGVLALRLGILLLQSALLAWLWNSYIIVWWSTLALPVVHYYQFFVVGWAWILALNILMSARK